MTAAKKPDKRVYHLVDFRYGDTDDPTVHKLYTNWSRDIFGFQNLVYVSRPAMELEIPENTGLLDDKPLKIQMPIPPEGDAFLEALAVNIAPHAPVEVYLTEFERAVDLGEPALVERPFAGMVTNTVKNFRNKKNVILIEAVSAAGLLANVSLGFPAQHHCPWTLYHASTCKVNKIPLREFLDVDTIDGRTLTTVQDPAFAATEKWFHAGWISFGGLTIRIRDWSDSAPKVFELAQQPPTDWDGQQVEIVPGCAKTIEDCRDKFNNEANFGGSGYAMLPYQPNFEGQFSV